MTAGGANNQFVSPEYFCTIIKKTRSMAYKYDPATGEFVDTSSRRQPTPAPRVQQTAPRQHENPQPRSYRQNPRTAMSTVYGGTSRYNGRKREYFRWWILRMCVYVGIAMLFNLCSR